MVLSSWGNGARQSGASRVGRRVASARLGVLAA